MLVTAALSMWDLWEFGAAWELKRLRNCDHVKSEGRKETECHR